MNEASKSRKYWGALEQSVLVGRGIDIGCGPDPVTPEARRFDLEHGDANVVNQNSKKQFEFVYSSPCLEHMHNHRSAATVHSQTARHPKIQSPNLIQLKSTSADCPIEFSLLKNQHE
jgi:hypothetical protein